MMDELKNCPFCGGEAEIKATDGRYGIFVCIACSICDAQAKRFKVRNDDEVLTGGAAKKAVLFWNRRE